MERGSHRPSIEEVLQEQRIKEQQLSRRQFMGNMIGGGSLIALDAAYNSYSPTHHLYTVSKEYLKRVFAPRDELKQGFDEGMSKITSGLTEYDIRGGLFVVHDSPRLLYPDTSAHVLYTEGSEIVKNPISSSIERKGAADQNVSHEEWLIYFSSMYKGPVCVVYDSSHIETKPDTINSFDQTPIHKVITSFYDDGKDNRGRTWETPTLRATERNTRNIYEVGKSIPAVVKKP